MGLVDNLEEKRKKHREYMRKWRKENPEKVKRISKTDRENNREKIMKHRKDNPEMFRDASRQWRKEHPEEVRAQKRKYSRENLEHKRKKRAERMSDEKTKEDYNKYCRKRRSCPDVRFKESVRDKTKQSFPLEGQPCVGCGKDATCHHHTTSPYEYDKFEFMCSKCHGIEHRRYP